MTTTPTPPPTRNLQGILWKTLACACFAGLNVIVRYLTGGAGGTETPLPAMEIAGIQNAIGFCLMLPFLLGKHSLASLKSKYITLHGVRVLMGGAGMVLLYIAFSVMPTAKAVALGFMGPVFTVIGAAIYLKERMGLLRTFGITLGMLGAFLITRPDLDFMKDGGAQSVTFWAFLLPLGSAACFAVCKIVGRELTNLGDSASLLTVYLLVFMAPVCLIPASFHWVTPEGIQWLWLLALGVLASLAHYAMAQSYACAEIVFLTPFGFSRLLFSAAIAFAAFGELPKAGDFWLGTAIVFLGTVAICYEEEQDKKRHKKNLLLQKEALASS